MLAEIRCNERREDLKGNFSDVRIPFHLAAPKRRERCCTEELLFSLALLKFDEVIEVLIVDICRCNVESKRLPHPC